jgi:hypothetical protein
MDICGRALGFEPKKEVSWPFTMDQNPIQRLLIKVLVFG